MKKFLKYAFVAALVTVAGYGVYASQKSDAMSDLMLANVEALARGEGPTDCPGGRHLCAWITSPMGSVTYYDENGSPDI